jgi:hypothetical protein
MEVLLEADVPADQSIDSDSMAAAKSIVESRVNAWASPSQLCNR